VRWRLAARGGEGGSAAGWLRGANCLGATVGAILAAYLLAPRLGLSGAVLVAAAASFTAAGLSMGFSRARGSDVAKGVPPTAAGGKNKDRKKSDESREKSREGLALPISAAVLLAGLTGALTLCSELAQVRAISFFTSSTLYSFAAVTAAYLACLGIGSGLGAILAWWFGRERAGLPLAAIMLLAGAGAGMSAWLLSTGWGGESALGTALLCCAPTALPLGAAFPVLVTALDASEGRVGRAVGLAGAGLELGSAAGPLLAALVLLPMLGTRFTLLGVGVCAVLGAVALTLRAGRRAWGLRAAALVALIVAVLLPLRGELYARAVTEKIRKESGLNAELDSLHEGPEAVISVVRTYQPAEGREVKALYIGRKMQAEDSEPWLRIEKVIGALPALLCPRAKGRSFHVGLGSGVSAAWGAAAGPGRKVQCAEIVPGVAERLGEFSDHNSVAEFEVRLGDGRSLLSADDGEFELIVTDIVFPEDAGAGGLFSLEYFRLARGKLGEGGAFAHWLPLWQMSPEAFASTVRAFLEVFPEATLWAGCLNGARPLVMLLGARDGGREGFDPRRIAERVRGAKLSAEQLASINLASPEAVLSHFVAGPAGLKKLAGDARSSSDNFPVSELSRRAPGPGTQALDNLNSLISIWELAAQSGALGAEGWDEKARTRVAELEGSRLYLAEANAILFANYPHVSSVALDKLRDARRAGPRDPEIAYELWNSLAMKGIACVQRGDRRGLDDARGHFEDALNVAPDRRRDYILRGLAISLAVAGENARSLKLAREATRVGPEEAVNWEVLRNVAAAAGEKQEAKAAAAREAQLRSQAKEEARER
jgi:spermidine synthase